MATEMGGKNNFRSGKWGRERGGGVRLVLCDDVSSRQQALFQITEGVFMVDGKSHGGMYRRDLRARKTAATKPAQKRIWLQL